jgi:hypothetical protein
MARTRCIKHYAPRTSISHDAQKDGRTIWEYSYVTGKDLTPCLDVDDDDDDDDDDNDDDNKNNNTNNLVFKRLGCGK